MIDEKSTTNIFKENKVFGNKNVEEVIINIDEINSIDSFHAALDNALKLFSCSCFLESFNETERLILLIDKIMVDSPIKNQLREKIIPEFDFLKKKANEISSFKVKIEELKGTNIKLRSLKNKLLNILDHQYKLITKLGKKLEILKNNFDALIKEIFEFKDNLTYLTYEDDDNQLKCLEKSQKKLLDRFFKLQEEYKRKTNPKENKIDQSFLERCEILKNNIKSQIKNELKVADKIEPLLFSFPSSLENKKLIFKNELKKVNDELSSYSKEEKVDLDINNQDYMKNELLQLKSKIKQNLDKINIMRIILEDFISTAAFDSDSFFKIIGRKITKEYFLNKYMKYENTEFYEPATELLTLLKEEYKKIARIYSDCKDAERKDELQTILDFIMKNISDNFVNYKDEKEKTCHKLKFFDDIAKRLAKKFEKQKDFFLDTDDSPSNN